MTENCQQSLRQFVGSTYSLMVVVVGGEGERKHRAEMPSLVAGATGRLRALVYRDNSDLQTSTHVAVADKPSATSHDQLEHCHTSHTRIVLSRLSGITRELLKLNTKMDSPQTLDPTGLY